jgi:hypothetical protein
MFDKKKQNFWRLAVIFIGLIVITLSSLWLSPQGKKAVMMNESMANMAKMHLTDVTIYDLLNSSEMDMSSGSSLTESTMNSSDDKAETETLGMVSTLIVFGFLPLLIGGIVILGIVWIE